MSDVLHALRTKHAKDVFVDECKMGSSWHGGGRRLDAWVMLKTWSPWTTIGYEIKTSRSDFVRDQKWHDYLSVCHELYFACPRKLIQPEELPDGVGLLWLSGSRLITKRKAARREPDEAKLQALMGYVLMSRVRIVANMHEANGLVPSGDRDGRIAEWRERATNGRDTARLIRGRVRDEFQDMRRRLLAAEDTAKRLEHVSEKMRELGLDPERDTAYRLEDAVRRLSGVSPDVERCMRRLLVATRDLQAATGVEDPLGLRQLSFAAVASGDEA